MRDHARTRASLMTLLISSSLLVAIPVAGAASTCGGEIVTISGTGASETIEGTSGDDVIHARGGNDVVHGNGGADVICGGAGDDELHGGSGGDRILGGSGTDSISGGAGSDDISGQSGSDSLNGGAGDDVIAGGSGADAASGGRGGDTITGGSGNDVLHGGKQNDVIAGGSNADRLLGNGGSDWLHGNTGKDKASGGPGGDDCISARRIDACEGPEYLETFESDPSSPKPFANSEEISVSINSRVGATRNKLASLQAQHGTNCSPPPDTHKVTKYEDAVFNCRFHMMTAISAGPKKLHNYAVAMFSPNQMLDMSGGEATIRFDVSTLRASKRDWFEIWITPYDDLLRIPVQADRPSMQGTPRNGILIALKSFTDIGSFDVKVVKDFKVTEIDGPVEWVGYESFITPSSTVRSTFEIRLSKDRISVGMPNENFYWIPNKAIPGGLGFDKGIVQFGHNSYDVFDCDDGCAVGPNTWHWDNIYLAPAEPITALPANRRHVDADTPSFVRFARRAPAGSRLQFTGIGFGLQVSFDDGASWQDAKLAHNRNAEHWKYKNYSMKIPKGTKKVYFRGSDPYDGHWQVQDISVLSRKLPPGATEAPSAGPSLEVGSNALQASLPADQFCEVPAAADRAVDALAMRQPADRPRGIRTL